jgi:cytochrome o ubiquinol oxidase subunit 2
VVLWRLRYKLSLRDLAEMFLIRGIVFSYEAVRDWSLEGFIWIPPTGIVIGLGFLLWHYTHALDPYQPIASKLPALEAQVVGLDWKRLFIYPDQRVATVNRLFIPVDRLVHISLTSGTVMQALLIPQLAGQIYAMVGMTTQLNLAASRSGVYRGENTQFNGDGFQNEKFIVTALPSAEFDQWVARVRASAHPLDATAYAELFKQSSPPQPIVFSSVPQLLFQNILAHSKEPRS